MLMANRSEGQALENHVMPEASFTSALCIISLSSACSNSVGAHMRRNTRRRTTAPWYCRQVLAGP
eukprot:5531542-Prorocentrum_lima.AAC.1